MTPQKSGGVEVVAAAAALAAAAAERFVSAAERAVHTTGRFTVALSGGSTPRAMLAALASPAFATRVAWERTHVFWGDERCVPPGDAMSNYGMARELLLDHVPVPAGQVHRIHGEDNPVAAAGAYERELRTVLGTPEGPPRGAPGARIDLVLLGLGTNGHTASLFPGLGAVHERVRWAMAEHVVAAGQWRVTLTPILLNEAADTIFLVSGADKAAVLRRVLYGPRDVDMLPAQVIAPVSGRLSWLVDSDAAAELPSGRPREAP